MDLKKSIDTNVSSISSTTTKTVKRSWFGGCVVAVTQEGKMITIQYDDGTSECSEFPDKHVIVDDVDNGTHLANAHAFIPPPPTTTIGEDQRNISTTCDDRISYGRDDVLQNSTSNNNYYDVDHSWKDVESKISHPLQPVVIAQNCDNDRKETCNPYDSDLKPCVDATQSKAMSKSNPLTPRKMLVGNSSLEMMDCIVPGGQNDIFTGPEKVSSHNKQSSPTLHQHLPTSPMGESAFSAVKVLHDSAHNAGSLKSSSHIEQSISEQAQAISMSSTNNTVNMTGNTFEEEPKTPRMDLPESMYDGAPLSAAACESFSTVPPFVESTNMVIKQKDSTDTCTTQDVEKEPMKKINKDKVGRKRKQSSRSDDNGSKEPEFEDLWVACDRCKKWRKLPGFMMKNLPELWYCENNIHDPQRNNCDASEEDYGSKKETKKKTSLKAKLNRDASMTSQKSSTSSFNDEKGVPSSYNTNKPIPVSASINESTANDAELFHGKNVRPSSASSSSIYLNKIEASNTPMIPARSFGSLDGAASESGESTTPTPLSPKLKPGRKPNSVSSSIAPTTTIRLVKEEEKKSNRSSGGVTGTMTGGAVKGKPKEIPVQQEWVQCDQCQKWRRLPSTVAAEDLPEYWICTMNTWDPRSASCAVQEDYKKDDEEHVNTKGVRENTILGNASGGSERMGKLSYRTLLAGNGKRPLRPVSEKMRYAESLFLPPALNSNTDVPLRPMYVDSSVYRSAYSHSSENKQGRSMDLFTMLGHSKLWSILSSGVDIKAEIKEGHSVVAAPIDDSELLEIHPSLEEKPVIRETVPYMEVKTPTNTGSDEINSHNHIPQNEKTELNNAPSSSRCMKISKPWKYLSEPMI